MNWLEKCFNVFAPRFSGSAAEEVRDEDVRRDTSRRLGTTYSNEVVPSKQSELVNDDNTVKDANYEDRVFASAEEKTTTLAKISEHDKKTYWVGGFNDFTDPTAYEAELTAFVTTTLSREPQEGDQVSVITPKTVYQFAQDGHWFVFSQASTGATKQSELENDDYTVKDENYADRVFASASEKTTTMSKVTEHEKKSYLVGVLSSFTDPTAYATELTAFVQTKESRAPKQGDQVLVTGVNRVYHYDGSAWVIVATTADVLTKQSQLTNDDNTVKDADYANRVFDSATSKTTTLAQVDTNKEDIVDLQAEDVNLQSQITLLQKKSYWVGSISNFTDPSAYQTELSNYVQSQLSRSPQEGDQVSVLDLDKIYQYNGTNWVVFVESKAIAAATTSSTGIVKIGDGINVDGGVISIEGYDAQDITTLTEITLQTWADDDTNVAVGKAVIVYAETSTDGVTGKGLYRIYKAEAGNIVIDAYALATGKYYHKIKSDGTWGAFEELSGGGATAVWGAITGTLSDQNDLQTALNAKVEVDDIVDSLISTSTTRPLSAKQGNVLAGKFTDGSVTKVGTTTLGGTLQPIYLNAGTPTAGTQLYAKTTKVNGSDVALIGTATGDGPTIYAPTTAGTAGQYLKSSGTGAPVWFTQDTYAGGTAVTLNGTSKAKTTASFYAPTTSGTSGQYLKSAGSGKDPTWVSMAAYGGGTAVTLNGTSKAASTASFYAPTTAGTSGQILVSSGTGEPAWKTVSTLYEHNIVVYDSSTVFLAFKFVNTVSTAYTTKSKVAKALAALGFSAYSSSVAGCGANGDDFQYIGAYGTTSGDFYYYKVSDKSWVNYSWSACKDTVVKVGYTW